MLIGPLAHIKHQDKTGKVIGYTIDWSPPGVKERFEAEEKEWWNNQSNPYRGKFPGP